MFIHRRQDYFFLETPTVFPSCPETPVMPQTTVSPDLLKPLQVLSDLVIQDVRHHLRIVASYSAQRQFRVPPPSMAPPGPPPPLEVCRAPRGPPPEGGRGFPGGPRR